MANALHRVEEHSGAARRKPGHGARQATLYPRPWLGQSVPRLDLLGQARSPILPERPLVPTATRAVTLLRTMTEEPLAKIASQIVRQQTVPIESTGSG